MLVHRRDLQQVRATDPKTELLADRSTDRKPPRAGPRARLAPRPRPDSPIRKDRMPVQAVFHRAIAAETSDARHKEAMDTGPGTTASSLDAGANDIAHAEAQVVEVGREEGGAETVSRSGTDAG